MAFGATRWRIVRQLLTESMLLALIGGVCGVLLAQWGVTVLVNLVASQVPLDTTADAGVLAFTVGVSILAGLLFGLVPAIRASRTDLASAMKEKTRTGSRFWRVNLSSAMVVLQVGLSMVLLTGAGLFARSLAKSAKRERRFRSLEHAARRHRSTTRRIQARRTRHALPAGTRARWVRLPNVQSVSMATYSPMSGSQRSSSIASPVTHRSRARTRSLKIF